MGIEKFWLVFPLWNMVFGVVIFVILQVLNKSRIDGEHTIHGIMK